MKRLIAALCFALGTLPLTTVEVLAAETATKPARASAEKPVKKQASEKQKAQQAKMRDCTKQASERGLKGEERKAFMGKCMKA
jgi:sulfur relay (sulfurtransferase) complex TusBCD TusD component (DsrE family)